MQSTIFSPSLSKTPSLTATVCSKDPKSSFTSTDVSTNSSCFCPKGQSQVSKKMGQQILYKCEKTKDPLPSNNKSSKTCDETPFNTMKESNWKGLSNDSNCNCPEPLVKIQTKTNNNTYYTCSKPKI